MNVFKAQRLDRGLSQRQFAAMIGCSHLTVNAIERGSGSVLGKSYLAAADALGITIREGLSEIPAEQVRARKTAQPASNRNCPDNPLVAYMTAEHHTYRTLAELLGTNRTTIMHECRRPDCRESFVERLAEVENMDMSTFLAKYRGTRDGD